MKKTATTEALFLELDNRYGNPNGPVEYKIIVDAIDRFKEIYEELQTLKTEKK